MSSAPVHKQKNQQQKDEQPGSCKKECIPVPNNTLRFGLFFLRLDGFRLNLGLPEAGYDNVLRRDIGSLGNRVNQLLFSVFRQVIIINRHRYGGFLQLHIILFYLLLNISHQIIHVIVILLRLRPALSAVCRPVRRNIGIIFLSGHTARPLGGALGFAFFRLSHNPAAVFLGNILHIFRNHLVIIDDDCGGNTNLAGLICQSQYIHDLIFQTLFHLGLKIQTIQPVIAPAVQALPLQLFHGHGIDYGNVFRKKPGHAVGHQLLDGCDLFRGQLIRRH